PPPPCAGGLESQQQLEDAAGARAALHLEGAAVGLHDRLHDRQAEADPAPVTGPGLVQPGEAFEDPVEVLGGHAGARAGHDRRHLPAPPPPPPRPRARAWSSRAKRSKIPSRCSAGVPVPESATTIATCPPCRLA